MTEIDIGRLWKSIVLGALLGIFCIIGVGTRIGFIPENTLFLIGMWYNRVVMGFLVGLAGDLTLLKSKTPNSLLRGALLGLFVSLAISLSSGFRDGPALFAGIAYGIIIDVLVTYKKGSA
ncbi:MAG: hypothetical protein RTU92_01185 [Candidatus Thorarchaeota archaeon]